MGREAASGYHLHNRATSAVGSDSIWEMSTYLSHPHLRPSTMRSTLLILSVVLLGSSARLQADDWPQWMGPQRDSVWREDGIVDRFPKNGLKVTWRAKVQFGYAGPAVADGRVYVTDYAMGSGRVSNNSGTRDRLTGKERVLCFDVASGKQLWNYDTIGPTRFRTRAGHAAHRPSIPARSTHSEPRETCCVSTQNPVSSFGANC